MNKLHSNDWWLPALILFLCVSVFSCSKDEEDNVTNNTPANINNTTPKCPNDKHPHLIDLGIGVKWACCNVGASKPTEYGTYFAWGETTPKTTYDRSTYTMCSNGSLYNITKYCTNASYGAVDNKTTLDLSDDAAHINWDWDGSWRMPTADELSELHSKCTWTWTTKTNPNGYLVTGPNGNSIFLPPGGGFNHTGSLSREGETGYYWSSSLGRSGADCAYFLIFASGVYSVNYSDGFRYSGFSVRPVSE